MTLTEGLGYRVVSWSFFADFLFLSAAATHKSRTLKSGLCIL